MTNKMYVQCFAISSILFSATVASTTFSSDENVLDKLILDERSSQSFTISDYNSVDSIVDNVQKRFAKLAESLNQYQIKAESAKKAADLAARKAEVRAEQTSIELSRAQKLLDQLLTQETVSIKFDEGQSIDNIVSETQKEISRLTVQLQKERIQIEREIKQHKTEANKIQIDIEQARAEKKRVQELLNQLSISSNLGQDKSSSLISPHPIYPTKNVLQKSIKGYQLVSLDDVYFATDLAKLNDEGTSTIQSVANYMNQNPLAEVLITGHADFRGESPYNQTLSKLRAEAVSLQLLNNGIDKNRFIVHGYGEDRPKLEGNHEAALQRNRRVEINILR
jgi:outer membrane protein OmpA-like peptidoglycan-associated protein